MSDFSENIRKETIGTWNKVAKLYEEKFMDLDIYNATYDALISSFPKKEADVFEIGCGPGNISKYILNHRPLWRWKGIDAAENMVVLANKNNPSAHFEVGDASTLQLPPLSQDILIAGFCIPYFSLEETGAFISSAHTILKEGGVLYLSYVPGDPDRSGFQTSSTGYRSFFHFFTCDQINEMLFSNGFSVLATFQIDYQSREIHEVIIGKKK